MCISLGGHTQLRIVRSKIYEPHKANRGGTRLVTAMAPDRVQEVPIHQIRASRLLVLRPLGPQDFAKIVEVSESMKLVGQLQPILVSEQQSDGSYEVVFGTHRFEAAKRLGWPTIRCYVRTSPLDADMICSSVAAFESRFGVQLHPEHLSRLAMILQRMGFTDPFFQEWKIGQRFGLSRSLSSLLEWHVRGFANGILNSEVEVSRNWLQHIAARPGSYYSPLLRILDRIGMPFGIVGRIPPDSSYIYLPELFGKVIPIQVPNVTL